MQNKSVFNRVILKLSYTEDVILCKTPLSKGAKSNLTVLHTLPVGLSGPVVQLDTSHNAFYSLDLTMVNF